MAARKKMLFSFATFIILVFGLLHSPRFHAGSQAWADVFWKHGGTWGDSFLKLNTIRGERPLTVSSLRVNNVPLQFSLTACDDEPRLLIEELDDENLEGKHSFLSDHFSWIGYKENNDFKVYIAFKGHNSTYTTLAKGSVDMKGWTEYFSSFENDKSMANPYYPQLPGRRCENIIEQTVGFKKCSLYHYTTFQSKDQFTTKIIHQMTGQLWQIKSNRVVNDNALLYFTKKDKECYITIDIEKSAGSKDVTVAYLEPIPKLFTGFNRL